MGDSDSDQDRASAEDRPSHKFSICHINAQSLRNKIDHFEIEAEVHDLIGITETWLHDGIET